MTKEEMNEFMEQVYENLSKEQFENLLQRCSEEIRELFDTGEIELSKDEVGNVVCNSNTEFYKLAVGVYYTVRKSRRITLKQLKTLSVFCHYYWPNPNKETETNYKQF